MTVKEELLSQLDRKISIYERRAQRARAEWEDDPTVGRLELYAQLKGKWCGLSEARKLISCLL